MHAVSLSGSGSGCGHTDAGADTDAVVAAGCPPLVLALASGVLKTPSVIEPRLFGRRLGCCCCAGACTATGTGMVGTGSSCSKASKPLPVPSPARTSLNTGRPLCTEDGMRSSSSCAAGRTRALTMAEAEQLALLPPLSISSFEIALAVLLPFFSCCCCTISQLASEKEQLCKLTATPSDEDEEEADDEEEALAREKDRAGFFQGSLPP